MRGQSMMGSRHTHISEADITINKTVIRIKKTNKQYIYSKYEVAGFGDYYLFSIYIPIFILLRSLPCQLFNNALHHFE